MTGGSGAAGYRTLVKVCGVTRLEDARVALEAGADWLGVVLAGESPRRVSADDAAAIRAALGACVLVAVMDSPGPEDALALATRAGATCVQLHRVDPRTWPASFPLPVLFSVPMDAAGKLAGALPPYPHLVHLDAAHPTLAGGTGRTLPWDAAARVAAERAVVLAGGLDGDNVGEAIARARPFGVDASSRLESAPGIKDADKVRRFVAAARRADVART